MAKIENLKDGSRKSKLRILHVSSALTWRGGENQIDLLIKGLSKKCINFLMCPQNSALSDRVKSQSVNLITYPKKTGISFSTSKSIKKICKKESIDLIHVHDSHAHSYAVGSCILGSKVPLVVTRRVDFKPSRISYLKYRHPCIKKVVCISEEIQSILTDVGIPPQNLCIIPSGIDLDKRIPPNDFRKKYKLPSGKIIIGFIGALVDHKDPITFLKMAKLLSKETGDLHFVMAGVKGNLFQQVNEFIQKYKLTEHLSLLGFIENTEEIWSIIDILVVTSKKEGMGSSVLEAFLYEKPVVATRAGGLQETIHNNINGLTTEIADPNELKEKVLQLLNDDKLKRSIIEQAKKDVSKYDYKVMSESYLKLYDDVV